MTWTCRRGGGAGFVGGRRWNWKGENDKEMKEER